MSANAEAMIRAGVDAYRAGKKEEARSYLQQAVELDQYSEMAWLWLSAVVESKEEQKTCLENVLVINPKNERARQGIKSLGIDPDSITGEQAAAAPAADDKYQVPSSSSSVTSTTEEPSTEQYDDWVDGLNLGNGKPEATATEAADDMFGDADFSAGDSFDLGDDLYTDDTFDDVGDIAYETADDAESDDVGYESDATYGVDDYGTEDDIFGGDDTAAVYGDDVDELYADIGTYEEFGEVLEEDLDDYEEDLFAGDPFAEPEPEPEEPEGPSMSDLFDQIPPEIKPQRLPGTVEGTPSSAYAVVGVLGVLNVLALLFLVMQFIG